MSDMKVPNDDLIHLAEKEEARFLNCLLKDKDCLVDAIGFGIKTEYFWFNDNKYLFKLIFENYKKYGSILTRTSMDSIMDMQTSLTDEQKASKRMHWDKIYNCESNLEDYQLLKSSINNRHIQRQAYEILQNNIDRIVKATTKQFEIVEDINKKFLSIEGLNADPYCLTMGINEGMDKAMEYVLRRRDHPEEEAGIYCGIAGLDSIFFGFLPGSYTVITGFPNGGKTTLMFNMGFNMSKKGYSVVYVSLEKQAIAFYVRLLSLHAMINYNRVKVGGNKEHGLPDYIIDLYNNAAKDIKENIIPNFECIQLPQQVKLDKIFSEVEKIRLVKKIDVLVIDYLGAIALDNNYPGRPDLDYAQLSARIQAYGRVHNIATITANQIKASATKDIRKKTEKVTTSEEADLNSVCINTEDLGGSQKVIYDCDNSIGVVLNNDKPPNKLFVNITKARDNESKRTMILDFDGKIGRISDPELDPNQIKQVDEYVYNKDITEEDLKDTDTLFDGKVSAFFNNRTKEKQETAKLNEENNVDNTEDIFEAPKETPNNSDDILNLDEL